jgi:TolB-like protein
MGCTEGSCLVEIGGALGVQYLLSSEVGRVGNRWLMSIALLDVARAAALRRVSRAAARQEDLVELAGALSRRPWPAPTRR